MIKKILKRTAIVLVVLIAVVIAAPFIFKGKILAFVKKELNAKLNAKVDFSDVDISFIRSFPKVAVGIEDIRITGMGAFENDTLLAAKKVDAAVNIMSIIKGKDMTIYGLDLYSPRIHLLADKDGHANWDIVKDTASPGAGGATAAYKLALNHYAVHDGYISYRDEQADMAAEVTGLNHSGKGDFTEKIFTLSTSTTADALSYVYNKIPFLSSVKTKVDADVDINNQENTYTIRNGAVKLNELLVAVDGMIKDLGTKGYDINTSFKAPSTDFKNILSLVPVVYQHDFSKIKTSGTAIFSGFVKGVYSDQTMPGYHVALQVNNGFFQYPDLPMPVKNIQIQSVVDNTGGQTDNTVVNIEKGHIELADEPLDFRLLVKQPVSNMFIDAAAKGGLDLSKVTQFVKLEKGTKLSGQVKADVAVKGNVADIEQQRYGQFSASGVVNAANVEYASADYPAGVKINNLQTSFAPEKVTISALSGQYLQTNFNGNGQLNNLLSYMLKNQPLSAALNIEADKVNLDQFMGTSTDTTVKGAAAAPFVVPANISMLLHAKVQQLHYDKVDMQQLEGTLAIADETVQLDNVKANALDGSMLVNGSYSTKQNKLKPAIDLSYDVNGLDVQKTFYAFNTVQKLMPIGQFIAGKLNSQLTLTGKLGDNMMPDMGSLTGKGNLLLIQGFLSKFAPLDKIASTLNVKSLEQVSLKDVKNYFEFTNGKILVKPFPVKVGDIEMEIGGLQGFDQSLNYTISMKLPRALMGDKGNQLVNNLVTQAGSKGVPVKVGDIINLNVLLSGFLKNPLVKTDLKQSAVSLADQAKQQALDFAKAKIDSTKTAVKTAVKDTIASVKKQALDAAKEELAKKLAGTKDTTGNKPASGIKESAKGLLDNLLKKKKG